MRAVALAFLMSAAVLAQGQVSGTPAFDVATIRPSSPGVRQVQRVLPSRIEFISTPLQTLILWAFRLDSWQLSAPKLSDRFDIRATYPDGATQAQVPAMLQTLLKQRFGLVTHIESRPMDAYELVVGSGGIRMREVQELDELNRDFSTPSGQQPPLNEVRGTPDGPLRTMVIPGEVGSRLVTSRSLYEVRFSARGTTLINAVRMSMREFATQLRVNLDRPVIDSTGLSGLYEFKVELDSTQIALRLPPDIARPGEPTGISTFKAVESLGLKLEKRKAPLDVLVVDKIARTPTDN